MPSRDQRAKIAQETLTIQEKGTYESPSGQSIVIQAEQQRAQENTLLYTPEALSALSQKLAERLKTSPDWNTQLEVHNETTLNAAQRLVQEEGFSKVLALNFASAKNPGGGFLGGSEAQEESLARSSGLYHCLLEKSEMYAINKKWKSLLYTDHMIYSPDVPVFRDDESILLEKPYLLSFLTAPAVNAGWYLKRENGGQAKIRETMCQRLEYLLTVALNQKHKVLVLGAWGCGVFQNNPQEVAQYFAQFLLSEGKFHKKFQKIVFAVLDHTKSQNTIHAFSQQFS